MSTIKSSNEHLTLNADGSSKDIKFQANGVEKASISSAGAFTSTTIDATKLTGALPAISGANLTGIASGPFTEVNANNFTYTTATNPALDVIDSTNTVKARFQAGNTSAVFGSASDHSVAFIQGASENTRMTITTDGHITIPNQPSFRAYKTASNTGGGLDWNGTYHNVGSHFNVNNGKFTAPIAGYYFISMHYLTDNNTDQTSVTLNLNSSADNGIRLRAASSSGHNSTSATHIIYLSANDYILPSFSGGTVYGDVNKSWTEFSGHLLG